MKIVFTNGCFDILHPGHIHLLKASRMLGSVLIVGLNSDESIKRIKGPTRPIHDVHHRKVMLEAIRWVDEVHIFDEIMPLDLIQKIKPDIITKGDDYTPKEVVGNHLAKVVIIPRLQSFSTTQELEIIR